MREEMKATATLTIAEKLGIEYKEMGGLYYPFWNMSDTDDFAMLGKYGHRWLRMFMEHNRYLYNQYFMDGTLAEKSKRNGRNVLAVARCYGRKDEDIKRCFG